MPYIKNKKDDVSIYYEVLGEGEPIALINGVFMNTKSWFYQYTVLSRKYRVILHDLRGQWNSDKPKHEQYYSIEIHADDLKELLDFLNLKKAHIVGTSYGGEIALQFAIKYPEYVRSLVVITAVSEIHLDLKLTALRWLEGALTRNAYRFVLSWINDVYSDDYLNRMGWNFVERLINLYSAGEFDFEAAALLLKSFLKLEENPLTPHLKKINAPTLVVAAEKDRVKPVKYSEIISENIDGSVMVVLRNAGHAAIIESPDAVNMLILGFIRKLED